MAIVCYGYKEEDPRIHSFLKVIPQEQFRKEDRRLGKPTTASQSWGERIPDRNSIENKDCCVKIAYPVVGLEQMPDTRLASIPFRVADTRIDRFWKPAPTVTKPAPAVRQPKPITDSAIIGMHCQIAVMKNANLQKHRYRLLLAVLDTLRKADPDMFFAVKNRLRLVQGKREQALATRTLLALSAAMN